MILQIDLKSGVFVKMGGVFLMKNAILGEKCTKAPYYTLLLFCFHFRCLAVCVEVCSYNYMGLKYSDGFFEMLHRKLQDCWKCQIIYFQFMLVVASEYLQSFHVDIKCFIYTIYSFEVVFNF